MLAEALLREPRMRDPMDPSVRSLWLWHALEESEHKAVAFDVYKATGGGYLRRVAIMIAATIIFFIAHGIVHARLMADPRHPVQAVALGRAARPGSSSSPGSSPASSRRTSRTSGRAFTRTIATRTRCSPSGASSCSAPAARSKRASSPDRA